ncbi:MAG: hypothetical protein M1832_000872 [Thelocarpon impressellum]|nr:MAG: hypothetical protein M1832_000872 [Thelocarpon impressellum]
MASPIPIAPRLIIHGGAGNITRENLPPSSWAAYRASLLAVLRSTHALLADGTSALDAATHAVSLLEADPLFNAGRGAVFTRDGANELEASVMVSRGAHKRGAAVSLLRRVKHPILLAKEMLLRGDDADGRGGGAFQHAHLSGAPAEALAGQWGLDTVDPAYFFTQRRWDDHIRGLRRERDATGSASWDAAEFVPQGTVGAVALDAAGVLCVATSTGGLTNKLPGRIGDTPSFGAGFWAEEWAVPLPLPLPSNPSPALDWILPTPLNSLLSACLSPPNLPPAPAAPPVPREKQPHPPIPASTCAVALSGTGNGDSFLRTAAARTACAIARFGSPRTSFGTAVSRVAGPGGELQRSASERWGTPAGGGEGEGGMVGVEMAGGAGEVVWDFNCGGMFRAWVDEGGGERCLVFREEF